MRKRAFTVGAIAVALALVIHGSGLLAGLEDAAVDARFQLRPASRQSDVVVVALDERSFDLLGKRPPLPRSLHARLLDRLRRYRPRVIAYDVQFTEETEPREDNALYAAVQRTHPLVLGTAGVLEDGDTRVLGSTANVEAAGAKVAHSELPQSRNGVYRRVEPSVVGLETLAFAAVRAAGRALPKDVDERGLLIDYAGPPGTVPTVSFADVLGGRVPDAALRGKAIVVGATAASQGDRHRTPASSHELMAGAEIHANALATVLRGTPLTDAPWWATALLTALLAALGAALATRLPPAWLAIAAIAILAALGVASYAIFRAGVVVAVAGPAGGFLVGLATGAIARQLRARRRARETRAALERLAGGGDVDALLARISSDQLILLGAGARFGDYDVDEPLGIGGMGIVYRATHRPTQRLVALKVMSASLGATQHARERFAREARAVAALDHAAVVTILDSGEVGGRPFLAMRLVEGGTLADLVATPALTPARAIELLRPIAEALDFAHERGVIHRDVKPGNILVDGDGLTYLADFGIAKLMEATSITTHFVGTARYTAPEQVLGEEPTGAADQYALGCVLFECLTTRPPFDGEAVVEMIAAHVRKTPPPASSLAGGLSPAIDRVLARALAKPPEERYATCVEFIGAAAAALDAPWDHDRELEETDADDDFLGRI